MLLTNVEEEDIQKGSVNIGLPIFKPFNFRQQLLIRKIDTNR